MMPYLFEKSFQGFKIDQCNYCPSFVTFRLSPSLSDWATVATFSTQKVTEGFPFGNVLSVSDGPIDKSSGTPYMYLTPLDFTAIDLEVNLI